MRIFAATVVAVLGSMQLAHAGELELKNDGFIDNTQAGFQAGFVAGEIGASRFVAPDAGRQLLKVHFLFGGAAGTATVTLHVWDDSAGTAAPGAELFAGDFQVTASNTAMQELIPTTVNVPKQFRVGVEFHNAGAPSIARDDDKTIAADKNYMLAQGIGWTPSQPLGLTGDWIIRATVSDVGGGPGTDAGVGGTGAACNGNPDCPSGQYCDDGKHCTFDCRIDSDCGGGTCNSLGQCVGGKSGGCAIDGGDAAGVLVVGMGVIVFALRRRRGRR